MVCIPGSIPFMGMAHLLQGVVYIVEHYGLPLASLPPLLSPGRPSRPNPLLASKLPALFIGLPHASVRTAFIHLRVASLGGLGLYDLSEFLVGVFHSPCHQLFGELTKAWLTAACNQAANPMLPHLFKNYVAYLAAIYSVRK